MFDSHISRAASSHTGDSKQQPTPGRLLTPGSVLLPGHFQGAKAAVPCGLHEGSASPLLLLGSAAAALPHSCCMIQVLLAQSMYGISPANVVGKAHWYSDKLTVRGMVPWRQTMVRIPAGAQCEWCWARATTLIKTPAKKIGRGGPEPWSGCTYPPFLNPPPVHWW